MAIRHTGVPVLERADTKGSDSPYLSGVIPNVKPSVFCWLVPGMAPGPKNIKLSMGNQLSQVYPYSIAIKCATEYITSLSVLTSIFQVDLGQPVPECLHSGFYCNGR